MERVRPPVLSPKWGWRRDGCSRIRRTRQLGLLRESHDRSPNFKGARWLTSPHALQSAPKARPMADAPHFFEPRRSAIMSAVSCSDRNSPALCGLRSKPQLLRVISMRSERRGLRGLLRGGYVVLLLEAEHVEQRSPNFAPARIIEPSYARSQCGSFDDANPFGLEDARLRQPIALIEANFPQEPTRLRRERNHRHLSK